MSLTALHHRRLREIWRSAGWPSHDLVELELLAVGWVERIRDDQGRDTLRVTDAGIQVLVATLARNRAARDAHAQRQTAPDDAAGPLHRDRDAPDQRLVGIARRAIARERGGEHLDACVGDA